MASKSSDEEAGAALYRFKVRTADGREAKSSAAIVASNLGVEGKEGKLAPVLYRFKVRTADGREVKSAIVIGRRPELSFSDLRWGKPAHQHDDEATLQATVSGHDGGPLRFVVEQKDGARWRHYATVAASVTEGKAVAKLQLQHPAAQGGAEPAASKKAQFRFKVEKGHARR